MERREFLHLAAGVSTLGFVAGCAGSRSAIFGRAPARAREDGEQALQDLRLPNRGAARRVSLEAPRCVYPGPCAEQLTAEPRGAWHAAAPIVSRLQPMGGVRRVTVHHEGGPRPNWDTTPDQVAETLRRIQVEHRRRMHAGDIGYHYIVDRGGRVWEGRNWYYQGAHVAGHNRHNIGVMVLGNFERQRASTAQIHSLHVLCHMLLHGWHVEAGELHMHCDLANTRCPGRYLVPKVEAIREQLMRA